MKEKLLSNTQERPGETPRKKLHSEIRKPFQEPILTRHETLIQNTHVGSGGAIGAVGFGRL